MGRRSEIREGKELDRRDFLGALGVAPFIGSIPRISSPSWMLADARDGLFQPLRRSGVFPLGSTVDADQQSPLVLAWGGNTLFRRESGFDTLHRQEIVEGILSTHPDTFWSTRIVGFEGPPRDTYFVGDARLQVDFARMYGFDTVVGRMGELGTHRANEWYDSLPEAERWRWPNGSIVEEQVETAATSPDGDPRSIGERGPGEDFTFEPSKHAKPIRDIFAKTAIDVGHFGTSGLWIDGGTNWGYRDFSGWAESAFRKHLSTLTEDELASLGVDDPDTIDAVDAILDKTPPGSSENPATDPLYREFVKQDYLAIRGFFEHVRTELEEEFPDEREELVLFANQAAFMDAPELITITAGPLDFPGMEAQLSVPPDFVYEFIHKFGTAVNSYERPGFHMGTAVVRESVEEAIRRGGLDTDSVQTDLVRTQFAEQVAHGSIGTVNLAGDYNVGSLNEVPDNWMRPDGTVPGPLREITGFAAANRGFLRSGDFAHDVAVVLSIPTLMWNRASDWGIDNENVVHSFAGACQTARKAGRPYDVLLFGHPDLFDDSTMLERLGGYGQVVLPTVECISDEQLSALESFLDSGGEVICTGGRPIRTEDYERRTASELAVFDHKRATVMDRSPGRDVWRGTGSGRPISAALDSRDPQVELGGDPNCSVTVRLDRDIPRTIVQVVNYEFDLGHGRTRALSDLSMTVRGLEGAGACRLYRPGEAPVDVDVEATTGGVRVTIPMIDQWAVLVFGGSEAAVRHAGDESAAKETIQRAKHAIDEADGAGRVVDLPVARIQLDRAELALETGSYEYTVRTAEVARETADAAIPVPRVGVDVTHGQPESGMGYDDIEPFRSAVDDVDFVALTEWTEEILDSLDAVIVPPAIQNEVARAGLTVGENGFSENESRNLKAFVEHGGSVLLFGAIDLWDGWKPISSPFGVSFDGGPVRGAGGDRYVVQADRSHQFYPTETAPFVFPRLGTTFSCPEDATILYRFANSDRPNGISLEDGSIAGEPATALFKHGGGLVFVHASGDNLMNFPAMESPTPMFLGAVTRMLGRVGAMPEPPDFASKSTETAGEREATTEGPETDTVAAESPGFGVITALAGFVGAGYLLQKWRGNGS